MQEVLGVDIGNVIINNRIANWQNGFREGGYSAIPSVEHAFESLRRLSNERFGDRIVVISKCSLESQPKVLTWLIDNDFYNKTGISPDRIFFCLERFEKEKLCKDHSVTHFIDDRLEVLGYLINTVPHLYALNPDKEELETFKEFLPKVTVMGDWDKILEELLG